MPKNSASQQALQLFGRMYVDCQVSKQVGRFGCRDEDWSHQPQGRSDLFCYCDFYDGYDALWEQEILHERVEQCGTRVSDMSVRGPDSTRSTPRKRHGSSGISRAPAWSARSLLAIVLAFVAVALGIWFAIGG